jgi:hypothetical protein
MHFTLSRKIIWTKLAHDELIVTAQKARHMTDGMFY